MAHDQDEESGHEEHVHEDQVHVQPLRRRTRIKTSNEEQAQEDQIHVQSLRRSTRIIKDPIAYYNAQAVAHPTQVVCSLAHHPQ